jgi:tRNA modification GTPase
VTLDLLAGGDDTIAALATAQARSALAIVRMTGPAAFSIAARVIDGWPIRERTATLRAIRDAGGTVIERAVVVRFSAPRSFTGEDVVEITCHGGEVAPALLLEALLAAGARLALPGEFTRRALLNGRIDLLQAEAIGDMIGAESRAAHRLALDQLDRGLSRRILALRDAVISVEALIAYDIDFPEEDDGPIPATKVLAATVELIGDMQRLLSTARAGELVRHGALVVIAGPPNVGKSSLFNALLGRRRAIVTEVPGTTRDAIEALVDGGRWPLRLVDTAGVRETTDRVEMIGIEVSEEYIGRAEVILACGESAAQIEAAAGFAQRRGSGMVLAVQTKSDVAEAPAIEGALPVSAETGEGLAELLERIGAALDASAGPVDPEMPILAHSRHKRALEGALGEVEAFRAAWESGSVPAPVAAVHLREAARLLEDLIGAVGVEDVLAKLFADFCVGK